MRKFGATRFARAMNSSTDGHEPASGAPSGGTGSGPRRNSCSSGRSSGSRLVVSTVGRGHQARRSAWASDLGQHVLAVVEDQERLAGTQPGDAHLHLVAGRRAQPGW